MPPRPDAQPRLAFAGVTDVGRQRKHNEDCLLIRAELDLFCVADGMGGHNAGDVASKLVATSLGNYFEATAVGPIQHDLPDEYASLSPAAQRLAAGVAKANRDVHTISNTHQQHHGMGSTCVAIHLAEGMAHIAHVGDSRCYRIRDGEMVQMTRDHSLINDALDMKPDLTREELARLPKNIITRALGMKDGVKVDVKSEPALPGDIYLLCSDGLTGMVSVEHILDVINLTPDTQEACELLIAEANEHGGTDNISAVLVRIEEPVEAGAIDGDAAIDAVAHADIDVAAEPTRDELDIAARAELDELAELDRADLDPDQAFEIDAPPSAERITYASAMGETPKPPPQAFALGVTPRPAPPAFAVGEPPPPEVPAAAAARPGPLPRPASSPPSPGAGAPAAARPRSEPPAVAVTRAPILEIVGPDHDGGDPPIPSPAGRDGQGSPSSPPRLLLAPDLEVEEDGAGIDDLITPEEAAALAAGGEIDLDVRGPWPGKPSVKRCPRCRFELFPGNRFCVECGARVEAAPSGVAEP